MEKYVNLIFVTKEVCHYSYRDQEDYDKLLGYMTCRLSTLKLKYSDSQTAP